MKTIKTKISDIDVLIQVADISSTDDNSAAEHLGTVQRISGGDIVEKIKKATDNVADKVLESAAKLIFAFADCCKKQSEAYNNTPDELEIEYSISLGLKAELVIAKSEAESIIKVRTKWNKNNHIAQQGGTL